VISAATLMSAVTEPDRTAEEIEVSILMPCLNEAETIGTCIKKASVFLTRSNIRGEILIADNGSTDGSVQIAERLGARVVHVASRGYGAALRHGIEAARGRFIIMGDSDDSYDFSELDGFIAKLRDGFDLVMGNRFHGGIAPGAMPPLHRYLGNPALSFVGRTLFKMNIGDFYCGLRGFRRDSILNLGLISSGMEFALEMVVRTGLAHLKIAEVPTALSPDGRSRPPHLRTWRDGWRSMRFFLLFSPRWLFLYPGIALLLLGLAASSLLLLGPFPVGRHISVDLHTLVVTAMATIAGLQTISFAIIARRYAASRGFLPKNPRLEKKAHLFTLEHALVVALVLAVLGITGVVWCLVQWVTVDFGPLEYGQVMRVLIVSMTMVVIAVQLSFTAFLAALLDIPADETTRQR
jgi:glycosyltransferase involved in cell wall biosynthesis